MLQRILKVFQILRNLGKILALQLTKGVFSHCSSKKWYILSLFIDVKSIQVISGFNLKRPKKITMALRYKIEVLLFQCSYIFAGLTNEELKKLWKTVKIEQKLSKKPWILKVFQILRNLGKILALQLTKGVFSLVFWIFWHHWHPWGRVNSGNIIVLIFVFDNFVPQRHGDFFQSF